MDIFIDDSLGQYSQCSNKSETCVVKTQQPISVSNSPLLPGIGFPRHHAHESPSLQFSGAQFVLSILDQVNFDRDGTRS